VTARIVVALSGQVSAGKTTAGYFLRDQGLGYTRISWAIKEHLASLARPMNAGDEPSRRQYQNDGISADAKRLADRADKRIFYIGLGTGVAAIIAVIAIYVTALSAIQDASSAVHGSADIVEQARRTEKERSAETVTIRQLSARMNALEERERRKAQESLNTTGSVEKSGQ